MKLSHLLFAAALVGTPIAHAQSDMKHGHEAPSQSVASSSHHASGVVKSVDAAKGSVTIAHGPVETLKWPAMTMSFKAKDKNMLEQLKPGATIAFDFEQRGKDYVITRLK